MILVVGGTGALGSRIARQLKARAVPFRALVRSASDTRELEAMDIDLVSGDLGDRSSLTSALAGVHTVITTATAISRALAGDPSATIENVDARGNTNLVEGAESAGVERFVFVSFPISPTLERSPLGAAKRRAERRLTESPMREVIVKPEMFQEVWLSKIVGLNWEAGKVRIFGKGETPNAYVAIDDVATATVRLALHDDPPRQVAFGGPEALTRKQVVEQFEQGTGRPMKSKRVPRVVLRGGSTMLRRLKPVEASLMALSLEADTQSIPLTADPLRELGIDPRPASVYIHELVRSA